MSDERKMTVTVEDSEFEKEIIEGGSCIAVPFEICCKADGNVKLHVYSFCRNIADKFLDSFGSEPMSEKAVGFICDSIGPIMTELGFEVTNPKSHLYYEYRCENPDISKILSDCVIINTLKKEKWDNLELDEFELDKNDPTDRMSVIRRNGKIVCYAGINDISDDDGLFELTVECEEDYRGQGFAASCIASLANYLIGLGEGVKYVTSESNYASQKTADSAGFVFYKKVLPFVCYRDAEEEGEEF